MVKSVWDLCQLDSDSLAAVGKIHGNITVADTTAQAKAGDAWRDSRTAPSSSSGTVGSKSASIFSLQESIIGAEAACQRSVKVSQSIIDILDEVAAAHADVTGRTNSLMSNCEHLLEQQHTFQQTVEVLRTTLGPFNDIEQIADLLGIPFDPDAHTSMRTPRSGANPSVLAAGTLDPRSPEFRDVLSRLAKAAIFLKTHRTILDADRYRCWLEKLEARACSLVGRAMRDLIDRAARSCTEAAQQKAYRDGNKFVAEEGPVESAPLYQKFRGLSFRLRELSALLLRGCFAESLALNTREVRADAHLGKQRPRKGKPAPYLEKTPYPLDVPVLAEVRAGYGLARSELLLPFLRDAWLSALVGSSGGGGDSGGGQSDSELRRSGASSGIDLVKLVEETRGLQLVIDGGSVRVSLCAGVRQAFSSLLRVTQLEQQLFESLFVLPDEPPGTDASPLSTPSASASASASTPTDPPYSASAHLDEVFSVVEAIANATRDFLRPFVIRESSVDELCRVVATLSEDVRSQMLAMRVPTPLLRQLLRGLDGTVNDAKERLSYCAEMQIRFSVQLFEPLPSQLAYPDILEQYKETVGPGVESTEGGDRYRTWYPPMRQTLSLLSQLYGVVESAVFEDFARRAVDLCVAALRRGADGVRRSRPGIHGDLFLVRHLLALREQLAPFELRLQGTHKLLDFSSTGEALACLAANARSVLRLDADNGLLQLARAGLPRMSETQLDAKKQLDVVLKAACLALKTAAVKSLLGAMDVFLAKVTAFVGDIPMLDEETAADPTGRASGSYNANAASTATVSALVHRQVLLEPALAAQIKGQSFLRPERVKEMLESVQTVLLQRVPDLNAVMKLYIDNVVACTIILKPILQDFEAAKKKMDCVVSSCLDPGQPRRDVEHLLQTITMTVASDLVR